MIKTWIIGAEAKFSFRIVGKMLEKLCRRNDLKKLIAATILFFKCVCVFSQTHSTVKHIFYDLPLDKPRSVIKKSIQADYRFKSRDVDTSFTEKWMSTYIGSCSDNGLVKSKADSIEIELTFGSGMPVFEKGNKKYLNLTLLNLRYHYSSYEKTECEYENVRKMLRPLFTDTSYTSIDTIYSDSPLRSQFKAKGMIFKNTKKKYSVTALVATEAKNHFALYIEYERMERD